jgi:hypothetical protein
MQLELSRDEEAFLHAQAAAAGFQTVEEFILDRLELNQPAKRVDSASREQWLRKFDAFVAKQVSRNPHFDDRRESIYPVRG